MVEIDPVESICVTKVAIPVPTNPNPTIELLVSFQKLTNPSTLAGAVSTSTPRIRGTVTVMSQVA
jgi:hypothetical protein